MDDVNVFGAFVGAYVNIHMVPINTFGPSNIPVGQFHCRTAAALRMGVKPMPFFSFVRFDRNLETSKCHSTCEFMGFGVFNNHSVFLPWDIKGLICPIGALITGGTGAGAVKGFIGPGAALGMGAAFMGVGASFCVKG